MMSKNLKPPPTPQYKNLLMKPSYYGSPSKQRERVQKEKKGTTANERLDAVFPTVVAQLFVQTMRRQSMLNCFLTRAFSKWISTSFKSGKQSATVVHFPNGSTGCDPKKMTSSLAAIYQIYHNDQRVDQSFLSRQLARKKEMR